MAQYEEEVRAAALVSEKRFEEAQPLLFDLAEKGSVYASSLLGWLYEMGAIGPRNANAARYFYERGAASQDPDACWRLGCLMESEGKFIRAQAAFRAAAEMGHLAGMFRLGNMLREGRTGPIAEDEGMAWLRRAADRGHLFAEAKLIHIAARHSGTISGRLAAIPKIASILIRCVKETRRDIRSPKLER
jgi:hypothetical protein